VRPWVLEDPRKNPYWGVPIRYQVLNGEDLTNVDALRKKMNRDT